jgi:sugar lactone lactonase YvrE
MFRRILIVAALTCAAITAAPAAAGSYPETIPLPAGWQPEGIAIGHGKDVFAGSRVTGAIWKGDLRSGRGSVFVPPRTGGAALGMKVDNRGRLFVAGGGTGTASVYDSRSGRLLARYALTAAPTFVNDVIVTRKAAYFTDSQRQQLYVLDLGRRGKLPVAARTLELTGELQYDTDPATFELNGIETLPGGRRLIAVQSGKGKLFAIHPRTGDTEEVDLDGGTVTNGDGLLRQGRWLYVVQNRDNRIAVVRLDRDGDDGRIVDTITDPDFDVPTTLAARGHRLWTVNARFTTPPTPTTAYDIVKVG